MAATVGNSSNSFKGLSHLDACIRLSKSLRAVLVSDKERLRSEDKVERWSIFAAYASSTRSVLVFVSVVSLIVAYAIEADAVAYSSSLSVLTSAILLFGGLLADLCMVYARSSILRWETHQRVHSTIIEFERATGVYHMNVASGPASTLQSVTPVPGTPATPSTSPLPPSPTAPPTGPSVTQDGILLAFSGIWQALEWSASGHGGSSSKMVHSVPVYRDGSWCRLPVALCVKGDLLALSYKEAAPGKVRAMDGAALGRRGSIGRLATLAGKATTVGHTGHGKETATAGSATPGPGVLPRSLLPAGDKGDRPRSKSPSHVSAAQPLLPRVNSVVAPVLATSASEAKDRERHIDALTLCGDLRRFTLLETPAETLLRRRLRAPPRPQPLFLMQLRSYARLASIWGAGLSVLVVLAIIVRQAAQRAEWAGGVQGQDGWGYWVGTGRMVLVQLPTFAICALPLSLPVLLWAMELLGTARLLAVHEFSLVRSRWKAWKRSILLDALTAAGNLQRADAVPEPAAAAPNLAASNIVDSLHASGDASSQFLQRRESSIMLTSDATSLSHPFITEGIEADAGAGAAASSAAAGPRRGSGVVIDFGGDDTSRLQPSMQPSSHQSFATRLFSALTTASSGIAPSATAARAAESTGYNGSDSSDESDDGDDDDGIRNSVVDGRPRSSSGSSDHSDDEQDNQQVQPGNNRQRTDLLGGRDASDMWGPERDTRGGLGKLARQLRPLTSADAAVLRAVQSARPDLAGVDQHGEYVPAQYAGKGIPWRKGHLNDVSFAAQLHTDDAHDDVSPASLVQTSLEKLLAAERQGGMGMDSSFRILSHVLAPGTGDVVASALPHQGKREIPLPSMIGLFKAFFRRFCSSCIRKEIDASAAVTDKALAIRRVFHGPSFSTVASQTAGRYTEPSLDRISFYMLRLLGVMVNAPPGAQRSKGDNMNTYWSQHNSILCDDLVDVGFGLSPVPTPSLGSQLLLRMGTSTVCMAGDRAVVCESAPTVESIMMLKGHTGSAILTLHPDETSSSGVRFDDSHAARKHATSLRPLGLAALVGARKGGQKKAAPQDALIGPQASNVPVAVEPSTNAGREATPSKLEGQDKADAAERGRQRTRGLPDARVAEQREETLMSDAAPQHVTSDNSAGSDYEYGKGAEGDAEVGLYTKGRSRRNRRDRTALDAQAQEGAQAASARVLANVDGDGNTVERTQSRSSRAKGVVKPHKSKGKRSRRIPTDVSADEGEVSEQTEADADDNASASTSNTSRSARKHRRRRASSPSSRSRSGRSSVASSDPSSASAPGADGSFETGDDDGRGHIDEDEGLLFADSQAEDDEDNGSAAESESSASSREGRRKRAFLHKAYTRRRKGRKSAAEEDSDSESSADNEEDEDDGEEDEVAESSPVSGRESRDGSTDSSSSSGPADRRRGERRKQRQPERSGRSSPHSQEDEGTEDSSYGIGSSEGEEEWQEKASINEDSAELYGETPVPRVRPVKLAVVLEAVNEDAEVDHEAAPPAVALEHADSHSSAAVLASGKAESDVRAPVSAGRAVEASHKMEGHKRRKNRESGKYHRRHRKHKHRRRSSSSSSSSSSASSSTPPGGQGRGKSHRRKAYATGQPSSSAANNPASGVVPLPPPSTNPPVSFASLAGSIASTTSSSSSATSDSSTSSSSSSRSGRKRRHRKSKHKKRKHRDRKRRQRKLRSKRSEAPQTPMTAASGSPVFDGSSQRALRSPRFSPVLSPFKSPPPAALDAEDILDLSLAAPDDAFPAVSPARIRAMSLQEEDAGRRADKAAARQQRHRAKSRDAGDGSHGSGSDSGADDAKLRGKGGAGRLGSPRLRAFPSAADLDVSLSLEDAVAPLLLAVQTPAAIVPAPAATDVESVISGEQSPSQWESRSDTGVSSMHDVASSPAPAATVPPRTPGTASSIGSLLALSPVIPLVERALEGSSRGMQFGTASETVTQPLRERGAVARALVGETRARSSSNVLARSSGRGGSKQSLYRTALESRLGAPVRSTGVATNIVPDATVSSRGDALPFSRLSIVAQVESSALSDQPGTPGGIQGAVEAWSLYEDRGPVTVPAGSSQHQSVVHIDDKVMRSELTTFLGRGDSSQRPKRQLRGVLVHSSLAGDLFAFDARAIANNVRGATRSGIRRSSGTEYKCRTTFPARDVPEADESTPASRPGIGSHQGSDTATPRYGADAVEVEGAISASEQEVQLNNALRALAAASDDLIEPLTPLESKQPSEAFLPPAGPLSHDVRPSPHVAVHVDEYLVGAASVNVPGEDGREEFGNMGRVSGKEGTSASQAQTPPKRPDGLQSKSGGLSTRQHKPHGSTAALSTKRSKHTHHHRHYHEQRPGALPPAYGAVSASTARVDVARMLHERIEAMAREETASLAALARRVKAVPPRVWLTSLAAEIGFTPTDLANFDHVRHVHTVVGRRAGGAMLSSQSPAQAQHGTVDVASHQGSSLRRGRPPQGSVKQRSASRRTVSSFATVASAATSVTATVSVPSSSPVAPSQGQTGMVTAASQGALTARLKPGKTTGYVLNPALSAAVVRDLRTDKLQMLSQGSVPFVLANCSNFWDGRQVVPLGTGRREALLSTFQQWASEDLECVGVAYDPVSKSEADVFNLLDEAIAAHARAMGHTDKGQGAAMTDPHLMELLAKTKAGTDKGSKRALMLALGRCIRSSDIGLGFDNNQILLLARDVKLNAQVDVRTRAKSGDWLQAVYGASAAMSASTLTKDAASNRTRDALSSSSQASAPVPPSVLTLVDVVAALAAKCEANLLRMQSGQIFVGMVAARYQPQRRMQKTIRELHRGGVRFVYTASRSYRQTKPLAQKMGLETGWNCAVSLMPRKPLRQHRVGQSSAGGVGGIVSPVPTDGRHVHAGSTGAAPSATAAPSPALGGMKDTGGGGFEAGGLQDTEEVGGLEQDYFGVEGVLSDEKRLRLLRAEVDEQLWDAKAKLPHGVPEIRAHLAERDNVPLLVSLFTDATPQSAAGMIRVMQERGETVLLVASALKRMSALLVNVADVGFVMSPMSRPIPSAAHVEVNDPSLPVGAMTVAPAQVDTSLLPVDTGTSKPAALPAEPVHPYLRFSASFAGLHAGLLLPPDTPLHVLLKGLREARRAVSATRQALVFLTLVHLTLACMVLVNIAAGGPPLLDPGHALWLIWVILPTLTLPLAMAPAEAGRHMGEGPPPRATKRKGSASASRAPVEGPPRMPEKRVQAWGDALWDILPGPSADVEYRDEEGAAATQEGMQAATSQDDGGQAGTEGVEPAASDAAGLLQAAAASEKPTVTGTLSNKPSSFAYLPLPTAEQWASGSAPQEVLEAGGGETSRSRSRTGTLSVFAGVDSLDAAAGGAPVATAPPAGDGILDEEGTAGDLARDQDHERLLEAGLVDEQGSRLTSGASFTTTGPSGLGIPLVGMAGEGEAEVGEVIAHPLAQAMAEEERVHEQEREAAALALLMQQEGHADATVGASGVAIQAREGNAEEETSRRRKGRRRGGKSRRRASSASFASSLSSQESVVREEDEAEVTGDGSAVGPHDGEFGAVVAAQASNVNEDTGTAVPPCIPSLADEASTLSLSSAPAANAALPTPQREGQGPLSPETVLSTAATTGIGSPVGITRVKSKKTVTIVTDSLPIPLPSLSLPTMPFLVGSGPSTGGEAPQHAAVARWPSSAMSAAAAAAAAATPIVRIRPGATAFDPKTGGVHAEGLVQYGSYEGDVLSAVLAGHSTEICDAAVKKTVDALAALQQPVQLGSSVGSGMSADLLALGTSCIPLSQGLLRTPPPPPLPANWKTWTLYAITLASFAAGGVEYLYQRSLVHCLMTVGSARVAGAKYPAFLPQGSGVLQGDQPASAAVAVSQSFALLLLVAWFCLLSALLQYRAISLSVHPPWRNQVWGPAVTVALSLQVAYSHVHAATWASAGIPPSPFLPSSIPWDAWLVGIAGVCGMGLLAGVLKGQDGTVWTRRMKSLRLAFDTRLGMYSPR